MKIQVIIAAKNEEENLAICLENLLEAGFIDIHVMDGGSSDRTREVADGFKSQGVSVWESGLKPGRAWLLNEGAKKSDSESILFFHADVMMSKNGRKALETALRDPSVIGGGYRKRYDPCPFPLPLLQWYLNNIRGKKMKSFVGTNGIFVRREKFEQIEGFKEIPFLEDVIFSDQMKKTGRVVLLNEEVKVSSRRYLQQGLWRQNIKNAGILFRFRVLKQSPEILKNYYS